MDLKKRKQPRDSKRFTDGRNQPTVVWAVDRSRQTDEEGPRVFLDVAREFGWKLIDTSFTAGLLPEGVKPDGVFTNRLPSSPLISRLLEMGCSVVRIGSYPHPEDALVPAFLADMAAAGKLAAEHFASHQFKNMAFVGNKPWAHGSHPHYTAFEKRARELGCSCHLLQQEKPSADLTGAEGFELQARELSQWLATLPRPLGLLGYTARKAAILCAMCRAVGVMVPEDVAILGMNNDRLICEFAPLTISAIDPNFGERTRQAALMLEQLMRGETRPPMEPVLIPPKGVVERQSTDVLAVADATVAKAMRFMWDHLDQDISVDEVADAVSTHRRQLERAFRLHLGRGINAELLRKRLESCCNLLRKTDLTVSEIGRRAGFRTDVYLYQAFRKAYGTSPAKFRKQERTRIPNG